MYRYFVIYFRKQVLRNYFVSIAGCNDLAGCTFYIFTPLVNEKENGLSLKPVSGSQRVVFNVATISAYIR